MFCLVAKVKCSTAALTGASCANEEVRVISLLILRISEGRYHKCRHFRGFDRSREPDAALNPCARVTSTLALTEGANGRANIEKHDAFNKRLAGYGGPSRNIARRAENDTHTYHKSSKSPSLQRVQETSTRANAVNSEHTVTSNLPINSARDTRRSVVFKDRRLSANHRYSSSND